MTTQRLGGTIKPNPSFKRSSGVWRAAGNVLNGRLKAMNIIAEKRTLLAGHFEALDMGSANDMAAHCLEQMSAGKKQQLKELTSETLPCIMDDVVQNDPPGRVKGLPFVFAGGRIFAASEDTSLDRLINIAFRLNAYDDRIFPGILRFIPVESDPAGTNKVLLGSGLPQAFDDGLDDSLLLYIFRDIVTEGVLSALCAGRYSIGETERFGRLQDEWTSFTYFRDFVKIPEPRTGPLLSVIPKQR